MGAEKRIGNNPGTRVGAGSSIIFFFLVISSEKERKKDQAVVGMVWYCSLVI